MAIPLIAAGIAARAIASKLTTRVAGGITGAGAKSVGPVYRNMSNETKGIAKNSVKKVYYPEKEAAALGKSKKQFVDEVNKFKTITTDKAKSGKAAIEKAEDVIERLSIGNYKKPTIKINSNTRAR